MFMYKLEIFISFCICSSIALPVKEVKDDSANDILDNWENNLEYGRYMKEIARALEGDSEFLKRLEAADEKDIKSGDISENLKFVNHNVRSKLDEVKRNEMERIRRAALKKFEREHGVDRANFKQPQHLNVRTSNFGEDDLQKLIQQFSKDQEILDRQQQEEFKKHEMEKQYNYEQQLKGMDEEHRKTFKAKHEEELKKRRNHPKPHHPGSKAQFEEVWEEQDHMQPEDFDPKTFFNTHDLDGNGVWDPMELNALFKKELDKMYDPNSPDTDFAERYEEMNRMEEHVMKEIDTNGDGLISVGEFIAETNKNEFQEDPGWESLVDQDIYSQQDYEKFIQMQEAQAQAMMGHGMDVVDHNNDILQGQYAVPSPNVPQNAVPHPGAPQYAVPHQAVPNPNAPQYAVPHQPVPNPNAPQYAVPNPNAPQYAVPNPGVPQYAVPQQAVPNPAVAQHAAPNQGVPQQAIPQPGAPQQAVPQSGGLNHPDMKPVKNNHIS